MNSFCFNTHSFSSIFFFCVYCWCDLQSQSQHSHTNSFIDTYTQCTQPVCGCCWYFFFFFSAPSFIILVLTPNSLLFLSSMPLDPNRALYILHPFYKKVTKKNEKKSFSLFWYRSSLSHFFYICLLLHIISLFCWLLAVRYFSTVFSFFFLVLFY